VKRLLLLLLVPATLLSQETPPAPGAPRPVVLPKPAEKTLANGLRVVVAPRRNVALVSATVMIQTGAEADPKGRDGLADVTASLLTRGAGTRTAPQLAEAIEALGGGLESDGGWDASSASVNVLATNLPAALAILADVVRRPTFAAPEVERLRKERLDDLTLALKQPGTMAAWAAQRLVYGDAPYAHPSGGTPDSVGRIRREDVVAFHRAHYVPKNAVLVLTGDVERDQAFRAAERAFGGWQGGAKPRQTAAAPPASPAPRVVVIDRAQSGQAAVGVAALGIRRVDPDYHRGSVANSVLSGYSGRLNQEIRIKRGLSYGAGSSLDVRREPGPFYASAQTKNESAAEVATLLLAELERLAAGELPADELTPRKAVLVGGYSRELETAEGLAGELASLALYGLPFGEIEKTIPAIEAVQADEVREFARKRLPRSRASLVVVGEGAKFLPALKEKFPNLEVIPEAEVDFSSPTLRKK